MEMMLTMRMEDQKRERDREDRLEREKREQIEREEQREERRIEREETRKRKEKEQQAQLITTLKEAQPAVPQRITINNHKVPQMKEGDNLESFIYQLEAALLSLKIPRDEWRPYIHSQITIEAKDKVMYLLTDEDSTYDDIRAGLLGCSAMSFAATAEAIFGPLRTDGVKPNIRKLAGKVRRWAEKLLQEAKTMSEAAEKIMVGYIRAKLTPELKNYMDLTEASCIP